MKPRKRLLYVGNQLLRHGLSPTSADILPGLFRKGGFEVRVASDKKNKILRLADMLTFVIRNRKWADVVLIDTYSTQNFYYATGVAVICREYKIPYIPILRGGSLPARLEKNNRLCETLFDNALINVAPSAYLYEAFKSKDLQNLVYIPNTIPLEGYQFKPRPAFQYRLLWVRSFADIYNPEMAVEVVELLHEQGKEVSLCMIGPDKDGSLARCQALAQAKDLPVTFTGMLPKQEWITRATEYDIFINTTNFDNTPVSVIEAMALGLPIVSTNVGGVPFLIDDNKTGILTPAQDAASMASAIISLVNNPEKAVQIANEARKKVEGYDWEVVKEQWRELLEGKNREEGLGN